ncbi:MAG: ATP-binding cassette domain-containing protein [Nitriliruptorales bacterium]|nr:ATP-binding cassette domain-containing protein [Nitriliruptorales bacterium]
MTTPIATLRGVSKRYGSTRALEATDLDLHRGVIGLLGPNGAGKTTLLRLIASALPPSTGQITVAGHNVTGTIAERTAARRCLAYLPQEVGFPRGMTAFDFLDYIAVLKEWRAQEERHREVLRVLALVQLHDRRTVRVSALSGGQRRRLALAQALMGNPDLVVLDEPTTGLDPEQRAALRGILSTAAVHGCVLLATHQTEDVSALCDRVIVLDQGRVRFDGTVPQFVSRASGQVWIDAAPTDGALSSWRTGTGAVKSVGGRPGPDASAVEPSVEDAYLLLRAEDPETQGAMR